MQTDKKNRVKDLQSIFDQLVGEADFYWQEDAIPEKEIEIRDRSKTAYVLAGVLEKTMKLEKEDRERETPEESDLRCLQQMLALLKRCPEELIPIVELISTYKGGGQLGNFLHSLVNTVGK